MERLADKMPVDELKEFFRSKIIRENERRKISVLCRREKDGQNVGRSSPVDVQFQARIRDF